MLHSTVHYLTEPALFDAFKTIDQTMHVLRIIFMIVQILTLLPVSDVLFRNLLFLVFLPLLFGGVAAAHLSGRHAPRATGRSTQPLASPTATSSRAAAALVQQVTSPTVPSSRAVLARFLHPQLRRLHLPRGHFLAKASTSSPPHPSSSRSVRAVVALLRPSGVSALTLGASITSAARSNPTHRPCS